MSTTDSGQEEETTWQNFYEANKGREPRSLFVEALARFGQASQHSPQLHAIDLGCGDGTETLALLEAGWQVLAIDSEPAAIDIVRTRARANLHPRLEARVASFEGIDFPDTDFIYAGFSLPFCKPQHFEELWAAISTRIRPGGRFAGHLFGIRDSWASNPDMTFHSAEQVASLLTPAFEIEKLEEVEENGESLSGPKHWHTFDIIVRKTKP